MYQNCLPGPHMQICQRNTVWMTSFQRAFSESGYPGDVLCLRVFGQVIVVLCSLTAIKTLLERRGELYADRPRMPIFEMCVHTSSSVFYSPWALTISSCQIGSRLDTAHRTERGTLA